MAEENATERTTDNRKNEVLESSDASNYARLSDKTGKQKVADAHEVPYYKLFSFADPIDHALMVVGVIGAVGSGVCIPLMAVLFGELVDSFGKTVDSEKIVGEVSKVALKFIYLALGSEVACWTVTGERQAARIRYLYLKTVLRQDIGFFDQETSTDIIIESLSSDTLTIQDAIGEKVASYTGERRAISAYHKSLNKAYRSDVLEGLASGLGSGVFFWVLYANYALAIWYGAKMILDHNYTGGGVMNVLMATLTGSFTLGYASPFLRAFAAGKAAAFKMFQTIDRKPVIDPYDMRRLKLHDISGDIELNNVHFCYPARPKESIFDGFSVSIPKGTTMALVGRSGSGKSTVISLIVRFYDPQAGEVLIDGINIKEFQLRWIRGKIGLVSQEPVLFGSTIKDNIAYGKDDATLEEIKDAVQLANASMFIDKLPQDPKILLLDEATSALDAESERIVQETLDSVMINRTTVIVAHRLSTVKNADTIVVPKKIFVTRSTCRGSSRIENSSHHSPSVSVSAVEKAVGECCDPNSTVILRKDKDNTFFRLALMNKPEIPELLLGCIAAMVNSLTLPILGVLLSYSIKTFYEPAHELGKHSRFWSLTFVSLGLTSLLVAPLKTFFFAVAGCKLIKRIRLMCFEQIVYMEIRWFDREENSIGAVGSRLSTDAASVRGIVGESLALLVQNISTAIAGLVIGLEASWQLTLIMIVMKLYEDASQVASEAVGSIRTVASFSAEEKVVQLYKRRCEVPVRDGIKEGLLSGAGYGFSMFCLYSVYAISFYAGARLVESGKVTFAEVFRAALFPTPPKPKLVPLLSLHFLTDNPR
ncbi:ABC transporter B family member 11 [Capsicum chinense]|nr:ABC transporter B family member 11 [Capsicum chinense]